jgi:hypothetical protein
LPAAREPRRRWSTPSGPPRPLSSCAPPARGPNTPELLLPRRTEPPPEFPLFSFPDRRPSSSAVGDMAPASLLSSSSRSPLNRTFLCSRAPLPSQNRVVAEAVRRRPPLVIDLPRRCLPVVVFFMRSTIARWRTPFSLLSRAFRAFHAACARRSGRATPSRCEPPWPPKPPPWPPG